MKDNGRQGAGSLTVHLSFYDDGMISLYPSLILLYNNRTL